IPLLLLGTLAFENIDGDQCIPGLSVAPWIALAKGFGNVHATHDAPKDGVFAVEVRRWAIGDEELRAIGICAGVGHGKDAFGLVLEGERAWLVGPFIARAARAGAGGVAALGHEATDDTVKRRSVIESLARQEDKVVDCLRGLRRVQFD